MAQQRRSKIAYAERRLTQQEQVETDIKQWFELNGAAGTYERENIDSRDQSAKSLEQPHGGPSGTVAQIPVVLGHGRAREDGE